MSDEGPIKGKNLGVAAADNPEGWGRDSLWRRAREIKPAATGDDGTDLIAEPSRAAAA